MNYKIRKDRFVLRVLDEHADAVKAQGILAAEAAKGPGKVTLRMRYKALVWRLTNAQDLSQVPEIHLRAWRKYDLDHIISIYDGFNLGLPAEKIASLANLRIIPHAKNALKGAKSDFSAQSWYSPSVS